VGIILSLNTKNIYFVGYLSKNKITNNLKMNKPYSFSIDQMNGIVEDTYAKIINECENLKINEFNFLLKRYFPKYNFALLIDFLKSFFLTNYHQVI